MGSRESRESFSFNEIGKSPPKKASVQVLGDGMGNGRTPVAEKRKSSFFWRDQHFHLKPRNESKIDHMMIIIIIIISFSFRMLISPHQRSSQQTERLWPSAPPPCRLSFVVRVMAAGF